jgi:hypothetical protein
MHMANQMQARRELYFQLSSAIAQMDNEQLRACFAEGEVDPGWGRNHIIEVEGAKVFVKRIPVTDLEYANQFSTRNLYNLPVYYNYGVGSAGFGIFRELVTHIKTTNWVLAGAIENFPLLYHYRIIPATGKHGGVNLEEHQGYVTYWNNSEAISQFILDRVNANHEALLFLEYIPFTLETWLLDHCDKLEMIIADMRATIAFLRANDIIHFDAHWDNILTDGTHAYLSDFGLTLDQSFALSEAEAQFFEQNRNYDAGEFLSGLGFHLITLYDKLTDENRRSIRQRYDLADDIKNAELQPILLDNIEEMAEKGFIPLTQYYLDLVVKYREIIRLMRQFYVTMRRNHKKDTLFDHKKLTRLLQETGFLTNL